MRTFRALSLIASLAAAVDVQAQVSNYAWTLEGNPGGSGQVVGQSLQFFGADDGSAPQSGHTTWLQTSTPVGLSVSATCHYQTSDSGEYDAPVYVVNGTPFLTQGTFAQFSFPTGTYQFSFEVPAGASFGFGIYTTDACCGAGVAQFVDFVAAPHYWATLAGGVDPQTWFMAEAHGVQSMAGPGDGNGDGVVDLIVEADGRALAFSGADGATLVDLPATGTTGGQVDGAGDFDADGSPDFVLGLPEAGNLDGRVEVRSSADGHLIYAYVPPAGTQDKFGRGVAGLGDVNGDGFDDIAVSSPFAASGLGQVLVLGGPGGQVIHDLHGPGGGVQFGLLVAALDDVDLDGVRDLAVLHTENFLAKVLVYSGATAGLIASTALESHSSSKPGGLASAHDFNGDGRGDLAWRIAAFSTSKGKVGIYSGSTGAELWSMLTPDVPFGPAQVTVGDLDGDAEPDVVFSTGTNVKIQSGAGAHPLLQELHPPGSSGGSCLAAFGDVDLDGAVDLALSPWLGKLRTLHALDGNGPPELLGLGSLSAGAQVTLSIEKAKPNAPFTLVVGVGYLGLPFKGGTFVPQPTLLVPGVINASGRSTITATWPAGLPAALSFWSQAWIVDGDASFGLSATNGLQGSTP